MSFFNRSAAWGLLLIAFALPFVAGCDSDSLSDTDPRQSSVDPIFDRYVSIGNSITAGFQSDGISTTTQNESYAVLLADQMGTPFDIPAIREPGCPAPFTDILTQERVGGTSRSDCSLRSLPSTLVLNNVAVPGAATVDVLSNDPNVANPSALTRLILGNRTQAETALVASPTFASIWIGNNDVLGAALSGNPDRMTPVDDFESQYGDILDNLTDGDVERGVLISVANVAFIPNLSPGPAYAAAETQLNQIGQQIAANDTSKTWGSYTVDASCDAGGSGAASRVPFSYGFGNLFNERALQGEDVTLVCDPASAPEIILTGAEAQQIVARLTAFNAFIQDQADQRGWGYVDVNPALQALYAAGSNTPADPSDDLVPKFPNTDGPTFGQFFSEDGVHPSAGTHQVVTNLLVEEINETYGTSLQTINAPDIPSPQQ
ncbi:SGNH/GDSL hydrolase family protein [Longibacter sp.]|uniref:SGNH/GDSL hydrolase family protein n=1 Tax=Longibacter sp. TaxID=2045415 RepID=UPI003EBDA77D